MTEPITTGASVAAKFVAGLRLGYTTRRHNRIVAREHEDRVRWVRDQIQAEAEALHGIEQEMAERNLTFSGERGKRENDVRRRFAQQWRDRKAEGDRRIEDARDEEFFLHALWRQLVRRRWPDDPYADEVAPLTRGWENAATGLRRTSSRTARTRTHCSAVATTATHDHVANTNRTRIALIVPLCRLLAGERHAPALGDCDQTASSAISNQDSAGGLGWAAQCGQSACLREVYRCIGHDRGAQSVEAETDELVEAPMTDAELLGGVVGGCDPILFGLVHRTSGSVKRSGS